MYCLRRGKDSFELKHWGKWNIKGKAFTLYYRQYIQKRLIFNFQLSDYQSCNKNQSLVI